MVGSMLLRATTTTTMRSAGMVRALAQRAQSTQAHTVLTFDGDGIGREIVSAAKECIEATGVNIRWEQMDMGYEAMQNTGVYIDDSHMDAFEEIGVLFKGPLTVPPKDTNAYVEVRGKRYTSGNQVFRKYFQLFANVRPVRSMPGVRAPFNDVDLVVIRENTEDVYTGEETWVDADTVHCVKRISRGASERVADFSFKYARDNQRKRVTALHKANVCKQSDGLFLNTFHERAAATDLGGIIADDQLADSCLTKLMIEPKSFDVLCCPNLYGDLVNPLSLRINRGMVGSLGLCPSGNIGTHQALFEPAHGSAPDIAGKGIANPTSQILSGCMMLSHLGEFEASQRLENALRAMYASGIVPVDFGGQADTKEVVAAVLKHL
ncbi:uncharacterized protein MONBRDRAFT_19354 [Monosiga brevicollis MX1]|uniref:Isopropylmalate dehydrogenase-like domain-containing protein n=1 Tax=Monosiga brevicollis TaxID=81824 RepID=A9UQS3_MONBE|nr:uncharacterized protein MONBRDRAFT_19354 [Monosiga brevicollis MX1]EDQ93096.1 predicted protein [Monosiga brevicollis MX1]|eukprot:XP_001742858.1 hypothetical protein [Monosiga brevicollis MX1]